MTSNGVKKLLFVFLLLLLPQFAFAGSQTFTSSGTFTVPAYGTLTVELWGGGGGGGAVAPVGWVNTQSTPGGKSAFSTVEAGGGGGGISEYVTGQLPGATTGQGGVASGGDTNLSGGISPPSPYYPGYYSSAAGSAPYGGVGGVGGDPDYWCPAHIPGVLDVDGRPGAFPGGGGGGAEPVFVGFGGGAGAGAYAKKTYALNQLAAGTTVPVTVGGGGTGGHHGTTGWCIGNWGYWYWNGGAGAPGQVIITWTDPPVPSCSISVDQNPIIAGNATTLHWSSANASAFYISNVGWVGASGSASIAPNTTTSYSGTVSNVSGSGSCGTTLTVNPACAANYGQSCTSSANACGLSNTGTYSCSGVCSATTPPNSSCGAPTCSVTFDANPAPYGTGTTMRWTSARAASFTIQNVGPVTPNTAGSAHVAPSSSTSYNGSVVGHNGSTVSCPATLNVSAPPNPAATISSSLGSTVKIGQSSTITATFAAGSGDTLLEDNIDSPLGTGLGANSNPTSPKSITFTPSSAGTFTFFARARTAYYSSWTTYAQTSVTVPPLPQCSVTFDRNPITRGQSTVVHWSSSNATSFTLQTIGPVTPNQTGSVTVAPQSTTNYSGSVSGAGGSASCPATLTVQCTPTTAYSCSGQTIVRTDTAASCATTISNTTTCVSPTFCSAGSAACLYPQPTFAPEGHLSVQPSIVPLSDTTVVRWDISNVAGCTVTGTNDDSWTVAGNAGNNWTSTSGAEGVTTSAIIGQTTYTLTCTSLDGVPVPPESETVNILPEFREN